MTSLITATNGNAAVITCTNGNAAVIVDNRLCDHEFVIIATVFFEKGQQTELANST